MEWKGQVGKGWKEREEEELGRVEKEGKERVCKTKLTLFLFSNAMHLCI